MLNMSSSQTKIIKFGSDFTKLYQFNVMQIEMCGFLGHPVSSCRLGKLLGNDVLVNGKPAVVFIGLRLVFTLPNKGVTAALARSLY